MSIGNHIIIDITFDPNNNLQDELLAPLLFELSIRSIKRYMNIIHTHLYIFDKTKGEEPGWTSCVLLDSSHFTSHCYSERGMISMDLFTCQCDIENHERIMNDILSGIYAFFDDTKVRLRTNLKRF